MTPTRQSPLIDTFGEPVAFGEVCICTPGENIYVSMRTATCVLWFDSRGKTSMIPQDLYSRSEHLPWLKKVCTKT